MGLARFRAAARATERISDWVISLLRLTRIGVGRGLSQVTLHSSRQLRTSVGVRGSVMRSLLTNARAAFRGPRSWRGARSGGSDGGLSSEFGILRGLDNGGPHRSRTCGLVMNSSLR